MIRAEGLYKSFNGEVVLRGVTVEIKEEEIFAIIGRSGSGKTVLMKHLMGLLKPDRGRVFVGDREITRMSTEEMRTMRRCFGVLFQNGALFDSLNVFENTAFPLRMHTRLSEDEIERRVLDCLHVVQMAGKGPMRASGLSGGQKKRVALARAIIMRPDFLFYDEPNSGLDPQTSNTINALIKELAGELGVTSIVVTHDMHSVLAIADRVGFVFEGRMRFVGTVDELRKCQDPDVCEFMRAGEFQI